MKKAAVAVAHRILLIAWHIFAEATEYQERGGDHFDRRNPERTARKLSRPQPNRGPAQTYCPCCHLSHLRSLGFASLYSPRQTKSQMSHAALVEFSIA